MTRVRLSGSDEESLRAVHAAVGPAATRRGTLVKDPPVAVPMGFGEVGLEFTLRHRCRNQGNARSDARRFLRQACERVSAVVQCELLSVHRYEDEPVHDRASSRGEG